MAKKRPRSEELIEFFEPTYPNIRVLVTERWTSGKNLYDSTWHRPKPPVRDHREAAAILFIVQQLAKETGRLIQWSKDEQKRLDRMGLDGFGDTIGRQLGFVLAACMFGCLLFSQFYDFWQ